MTDPSSAPPLNLTAGPPRCDQCPLRTLYRAQYEGPTLEVDGVMFHAVGWSDGRMEYREGEPPPPPPRPVARPGDDSIGAWMR